MSRFLICANGTKLRRASHLMDLWKDICVLKIMFVFNPLSANPTKWSNPLKQFVSNLPTNCLSVFDHFVK